VRVGCLCVCARACMLQHTYMYIWGGIRVYIHINIYICAHTKHIFIKVCFIYAHTTLCVCVLTHTICFDTHNPPHLGISERYVSDIPRRVYECVSLCV